MIRIDTRKIKNWEDIKKRHWTWCEGYSINQIQFLKIFLKDKISDEEYKKENQFYDYISKNLKTIILSKKIKEEILDIIDEKYTVLCKELKNNMDIEFCNEGINVLNTQINTTNKSDRLSLINDYFTNYRNNQLISNLEISFTSLNQKKTIKDINSARVKIKNELENIRKYLSSFNERLKYIFNYKKYQDEKRHEIISLIGIEVCPYCQRNYITNYKENNKDKTTADLDHFYSKDEYPYLALSLYNFIPSCQICNRTFKLTKPSEDILYPYEESFDDYNVKFSLTENVIDNIIDKETPFKVKINYDKSNDRIKKTIDTFKLDKVYEESHNGYLKDMIENIEKYPKTYTKKLADIFLDKPQETKPEKFKIYQEKLQILNDNFQEIIKKPYTDKIEKGEPLAKLTKDIMEELGIK